MPVLFGAGIASYQTQRITEAAEYFRQALLLEPNTQVTNLAMAFALQRKRDFKNAIIHAKLVANSSSERDAIIISKRLLGLLYFQSRDYDSAISVYEELLDYIKQNDLQDELVVILYDMGFVCIRGENLQQAYEYWNQIYLFDRNYRNVQHLTTLLRKEMDSEVKKKLEPLTDSVQNYVDDWIKDTFPEDFMWIYAD